jgi:hypothetical protein
LHLDQTILVARQGFEFGNRWTVRVQTSQVSQLRSAMLSQQIRINQIGLGGTSGAFPVDGFGVDRIENKPGLKPRADQQTMLRFKNAGELIEGSNLTQEVAQLAYSCWRVFNPKLGDFAARFVNHDGVMMPICPVYSGKPPLRILSWHNLPGGCVSLYLALEARPSNHHLHPGTRKAKLILVRSVEPGGGFALSPSCSSQQVYQPAATLSKRAWF